MQTMSTRMDSNFLSRWFQTVVLIALCIGSIWAQDKKPSDKADLKKMLETAVTAQDHRAIAAVYTHQAEKARAKAEEHREMASWYKKRIQRNKTSRWIKNPAHCERLVKSYLKQAKELEALARSHEDLASQLESNAVK